MKKLAIWICVMLVLIVSVIPIAKLIRFNYDHFWKYSARYEECANDFNVVKNYIESQFSDESNKCLLVSYTDGIRLFDTDANDYLQVPDDVRLSLETICHDGFPDKDSELATIRKHDNRISFCTFNGGYALVFSPSEKPSYANAPNDDSSVRVKTIEDGWYHVAEKTG